MNSTTNAAAKLIPVSTITIKRGEGTIAECEAPAVTVHSFTAAAVVLRSMQRTSPDGRAYDKIDFSVVFADGEEYEGRYDLNKAASCDLAEHMVNYLAFYAGLRQPHNYSKESYLAFISAGGDKREASVRFLGTYELRTA